ncbi:MAG TPA: ArsR family transcriptional regulator [Candidatus Methanoperedenaceae archaeon]|nr:ArsR family transcriptional regulator [Candidatus Methanoperedenaceae archaeon]
MKEDRAPTTIMATQSGIVALDSPVKIKIIEFLTFENKTFDELVEATRKAKSTVSVHLSDLEKLGLIVARADPQDRRKKLYLLNSLYVARSQRPVNKHYDDVLNSICRASPSQYDFLKCMFHTMRYGLEAYGFDPQPIMKKMGFDIGTRISTRFESDTLDSLVEEVSGFWSICKMGDLSLVRRDPLTIKVRDCFDCCNMPNVGKTLCSLDEGILEGIIRGRLGRACRVKETECFGTGYDHCLFVISF